MTAWLGFGFCRGSAVGFFWRRRISAMADRRHHGEGEHHQGHMTMPTMPGPALVVIEPKLVFRGLKAILDRPPMAFDPYQRFDRRSRRTPGLRPRDRPIRDNTNHAAAAPWFQPLPTGA